MCAIWLISLFLKGLFFDLWKSLESHYFLFLKILTMHIGPTSLQRLAPSLQKMAFLSEVTLWE